jgi:hypothetical protein
MSLASEGAAKFMLPFLVPRPTVPGTHTVLFLKFNRDGSMGPLRCFAIITSVTHTHLCVRVVTVQQDYYIRVLLD